MTRQELTEQKTGLIAYLLQKVKAQDWHGVADAAMDLRETEAKLDVLNEIESTWKLPIYGESHYNVRTGPAEPIRSDDPARESHYNVRTDRYEFPDGIPDPRKQRIS